MGGRQRLKNKEIYMERMHATWDIAPHDKILLSVRTKHSTSQFIPHKIIVKKDCLIVKRIHRPDKTNKQQLEISRALSVCLLAWMLCENAGLGNVLPWNISINNRRREWFYSYFSFCCRVLIILIFLCGMFIETKEEMEKKIHAWVTSNELKFF